VLDRNDRRAVCDHNLAARRGSRSPPRSNERVPTRNTGRNARFKELQQVAVAETEPS
jgi:hypothetical protein